MAMPTTISSGWSTPTLVTNCDISSALVTSAGSCAMTASPEDDCTSSSAAWVIAISPTCGADVASNSAGGASLIVASNDGSGSVESVKSSGVAPKATGAWASSIPNAGAAAASIANAGAATASNVCAASISRDGAAATTAKSEGASIAAAAACSGSSNAMAGAAATSADISIFAGSGSSGASAFHSS